MAEHYFVRIMAILTLCAGCTAPVAQNSSNPAPGDDKWIIDYSGPCQGHPYQTNEALDKAKDILKRDLALLS